MEKEDIKLAIIERFNSLQPEIQMIIMNTNYEESLYSISKKYNLSDDQYKELELNTTLVLLGNTHPDEYKNELADDLKISGETLDKLVNEINEKILKEVLPIIRKNFIDDEARDPGHGIEEENKRELFRIGEKHKIPLDKIGELGDSLDKFLEGSISSVEYEKSITNITSLSSNEVNEIVDAINTKIVIPRRELLKNKDKISDSNIDTNNNHKEIPLPPYVAKKEDTVPLPPPSYREEIKSISTEKELEKEIIKEEVNPSKSESDMYREHGIEIVPESSVVNEQISTFTFKKPDVEEKIIAEPEKIQYREEIPTQQIRETESINTIKSTPSTPIQSDIIANKLFNTTISGTTVSDYTLPKITTQGKTQQPESASAANPHDPYHEII